MDKVEHEEFAGGDESIEDWLDGLEAKLEALDIRGDVRKIKWCKARIGSTGLQVLKGIEPINNWDQAKMELKRYFGDDDAMDTAWRNLEFFHSGSKSLGEIAAEVAKYARRASREEYTQQRLAVRAFINAIPRSMGEKLREKRITTLKKALEEAKYLQTLQEERDRNNPVNTVEIRRQSAEEEEAVEIQNQAYRTREATGLPPRYRENLNTSYPPRERGFRRQRRTECWMCRDQGHFARDCTLWLEFLKQQRRKEQPSTGRRRRQDEEDDVTFQLNLVRGSSKQTCVTPNWPKTSKLIYQDIDIGQRPVRALVDSGAEATCCSRKWYEQNKLALGGLLESKGKVVGVGNTPIPVTGRTQLVDLTWKNARTRTSLLVIPTLVEQDVILGMDILRQLGVHIDTQKGTAEPTIIPTFIRPKETWRVPAASTIYFYVRNPIPQEIVLYEPSTKLPEGIRSQAAVYEGEELRIRLENTGEEERLIDSGWEVGTIEIVQIEEMDHPVKKKPDIPDDLTPEQKKDLDELLDRYQEVFSERTGKIGRSSCIQHEIHTKGAPIRQPYRRQNPYVRQMEQEQVTEMLDQEVIRPSTSPWASPVVMVKKKDGSMRFCVDYRKLNSVTEKDAYPLPRIDDTLESLHGSRYFSTLDLKAGYWQVPVREEDKKKTAFRTSSGRLYEWNRLPFGLCNAPATFSRLMDHVLTGLSWEICLFYLDDIIVFSRTWEEHLQRLEIVFKRLLEQGLTLGATKCKLAAKEVEFLGHVVNKEGLRPNPALLDSITRIPQPKTVKDVRSFLGLASYYRRFVKGFSNIAAPLNRLLEKSKEKEVNWTPECEEAFLTLKTSLTTAPVTAYPDFDKPFRLYTDASNVGLGAILAQVQEGKERIICCASRSLNKSEQNYPATKKECLAIVWGIKIFRSYLMPKPFEIFTDHYSLQWLRSMKTENALLHRWAASLEDYEFEVKHRPGKKQGHVDALSRLMVIEGTENRRLTEEETQEVLRRMHQDGHLGLKKTLKTFRNRFQGVRDHAHCDRIIKECQGCQKGTDYKPRKKATGHINSTGPWSLLSIDIVGPLPRSRQGYRYVMTIVDCYSRFTILVPLKDHTATTVSQVLYERVIGYYGVPKGILTDRGGEFRSQIWKELMLLMNIQPHMTSPYYPQGNGIIERMHRTLGNLLRAKLIGKAEKDWPLYLPGIMMTLNEAPQEQHGYTPSQVIYGHQVQLPVDLLWPHQRKEKETTAFVKEVRKKLSEVRKTVDPYNQREGSGKNPFQEKEKILVLRPRQDRENKLASTWQGPYLVDRIVSRHQVQYRDEEGNVKIANISHCKKYIPDDTVAINKISLRHTRGKYVVQNVRELKRLLNKNRVEDGEMLTIVGRKDPLGTEEGRRFGKRVKEIFGATEVLESWMTWGELKERCGARSREEGVVCKARKSQGKGVAQRVDFRNPKNIERNYTIEEPMLYFEWGGLQSKKDRKDPLNQQKYSAKRKIQKYENEKRNSSGKKEKFSRSQGYKSKSDSATGSSALGKRLQSKHKEQRKEPYTEERKYWPKYLRKSYGTNTCEDFRGKSQPDLNSQYIWGPVETCNLVSREGTEPNTHNANIHKQILKGRAALLRYIQGIFGNQK